MTAATAATAAAAVLVAWLLLLPLCSGQQCFGFQQNQRVDCWPEITGATSDLCRQRGCCWDAVSRLQESVPFCFYPADYPSYQVMQSSHQLLNISKKAPGPWPRDQLQLVAKVSAYSGHTVRVTIADREDTNRWQVPLPLSPPAAAAANEEPQYRVQLPQAAGDKFFLRISRRADNRTLFDTNGTFGPLIFADQFLQVSVGIDAAVAYGVGEHLGKFAKVLNQWKRLVLWNHDAAPSVDNNLYGAHNFLLGIADDGSAFGIFLLNSNAQEVMLQPRVDRLATVTYRTIGGIFDFFVFVGPTPAQVVAQYRQLIGMPLLPPLWSLGFHLCRFGFLTIDKLKAVYDRNVAIGIPIDTMWADIDYMEDRKDWTFSKLRFGALPQFVQQLHSQGRRFVAIIDPGIKIERGYAPYDLGEKLGIFMRTGDNKSEIIGQVWPGEVVWPDFTHPQAPAWWQRSAQPFLETVPADGLWIDMNEPSNFYDGSKFGCAADNQLDNPPYVPHILGYRILYKGTVCPSALQYAGSHYDLHNMYAYHEAMATWQLLRLQPGGKTQNRQRQFVLSRSSFPGIQRYAFHWTGDNFANWDNLRYSISSILNFNLYGIVNTGTDVCGFNGPTNEELCIRWTQLAAFYPFMRNHNSIGLPDQDPAAFSKSAQAIMRSSIQLRYQHLPYIYTIFFNASMNGSTVARSMMEEFPHDNRTWMLDDQFLFGDAVLICPVVEKGATQRQIYLPGNERWFNASWTNRAEVHQSGFLSIFAGISDLPLFYRGGRIIAQQLPGNDTRHQQLLNPFVVTAALSSEGRASGQLFWDQNGSDDVSLGNFLLLQFSAQPGSMKSTRLHTAELSVQMRLYAVEVLGLSTKPQAVKVNGVTRKFEFAAGRLWVNDASSAGLSDVDLRQQLHVTWV